MATRFTSFTISLTVLGASLLFGLSAGAADAPAPQVITGVIVEVTTGDNFLLRTSDNREFPIGVWGVDSPEINNQTGQRARKFSAKLIEGERIQLTILGRDSEGRTLGRVIFKDGRDLGLELLKEGYAVWMTGAAPNEAGYEKAQLDAQEARKGIWKEWLPKKGL